MEGFEQDRPVSTRGLEVFAARPHLRIAVRARRPEIAIRLLGHPRLAQSLIEAFALLLILRAGEHERNRRKATECRYPRAGTSLLVGGERRLSFLGAAEKRVGRGEESVR